MAPHDLILHHYWPSPVAHKVRTVLGIKSLKWRSVEIPRVPPKPELMPLTGGYRRTPVMQIGADIYCDSHRIVREIEHRYPEPTLYPGGADGMVWGLSRWTDGIFFKQLIGLVLGSQYEDLPEEFVNDRLRLYFGPDYDAAKIAAEIPFILSQARIQFGWINERLSTGRTFILGDHPGLPDALNYYLVWFVRERYPAGPGLLDEFDAIKAWEARIQALGHGEPSDMTAEDALTVARNAHPTAERSVDENDIQGLKAGMQVAISPDGDGGDPRVEGQLEIADIERLAVRREDPSVGEVVVHFPRIGYRVEAL